MKLLNVLKFVLSHPLNERKKFSAFARFLKWQIATRMLPGKIVFEWIDNTKLIVGRSETGLTGNIYGGLHEYYEMSFLLHLLKKDDCFVDVGANLGAFSVLACGAAGARGFAFEPSPKVFKGLMDNIRINHLEDQVDCMNIGVGDEKGVLRFSEGLDTNNHILSDNENIDNGIEVQVNTLDEVLHSVNPVALKIDVEGYELPVIKGSLGVLKNDSLLAVIMELTGHGNRYGFDESEIHVILKNNGFDSYLYEPAKKELTKADEKHKDSRNIVYLRNIEKVRERIAAAPEYKVLGQSI